MLAFTLRLCKLKTFFSYLTAFLFLLLLLPYNDTCHPPFIIRYFLQIQLSQTLHLIYNYLLVRRLRGEGVTVQGQLLGRRTSRS